MDRNRDSDRPKILVAMEPVVGGTLRHLEYLLRHTSPADFDLHLAVSAEREPRVRERFEEWRRQGWQVFEIPMRREIAPLSDLIAFKRLAALCRRERYDVVHTHCAKAGFLGRLAARLGGAKTIHTPHVFPFGRRAGVVADRLYLRLEKLASRWTDRLVLLSRYQVNVVLHRRLVPMGRAVVIPNGLEPGLFGGPGRAAARERLGLEPDLPVALTMGRLCRQKGQDVLLGAARILRDEGAQIHFLVVGEGPQGEALREQVRREKLEQTVTLAGPSGEPALYYAAADIVVVPSRFEGMPYVLLEAKAAGRPVVISAVSGMEEFVRCGADGFLVAPGDGRALAEALGRAAAERGALDAAGRLARSGLKPEWTAGRSVGALHAVYRELAAGKKNGRVRNACRGEL